MRVAADARGGDRGAAAAGAIAAAQLTDVGAALVGRSAGLRAGQARDAGAGRFDIVVEHAADAVGTGERPAGSLRRKPQSSIRAAAGPVARGAADALFSAGSGGASS